MCNFPEVSVPEFLFKISWLSDMIRLFFLLFPSPYESLLLTFWEVLILLMLSIKAKAFRSGNLK